MCITDARERIVKTINHRVGSRFKQLLQLHAYGSAYGWFILQARVGQIQRRRTDPNLYVAVVGEFNGGKSTFINALLRQKILKSSVVERTAVPCQTGRQPCSNLEISLP
jgi:ribosome biogenesis GTPase A